MKITEWVSRAERIAVVGSPSSTAEITLDVLGSAVQKKLVGELALFEYPQEGRDHYALGQVTEVTLRNKMHEEPIMRSIIRQRGRVDAVSARQDTHQGEMTVSAVFEETNGSYRPSGLGTVPATGTTVQLADDQVLDTLLAPYREQMFYLGHVYGSTPKLPTWFKHFGTGPQGAGEAYHLGIFGKTGSGKSVLAKMILLAYARHRQMSAVVIDPQGEFAKDFRGDGAPGAFQLPMRRALRKLQKPVEVLSVRDLVLDTWDLFEQILFESGFAERLAVKHPNNQRQAAEVIRGMLDSTVKLADLHERETMDLVLQQLPDGKYLNRIYSDKQKREDVTEQIAEIDHDRLYESVWQPATELFRKRKGARSPGSVMYALFPTDGAARPFIVIDLSEEQARRSARSAPGQPGLFREEAGEEAPVAALWNESIQALVIKRLLQMLSVIAEKAYEEGRSTNTLVVMDEAHRLAPRETPSSEEQKAVRSILVDAARTTRKYGLGWMFISQTLSSLHSDILNQLRIFFFGFGLSMGSEHRALRELVGTDGKAIKLYSQFRDPHSAFDTASREYSFMTVGPVSPLSFAGTPLFFSAFNRVEEFLRVNGFTSEAVSEEPTENGKHPASALAESPFVGLWRDRDDLGHSSDFARRLREQAQRRQG